MVWVGNGADRQGRASCAAVTCSGEMALVRQDERSADVVAKDDVEVLAVDERFLQRIQRRYPRIAARVFLNLTRILSDRLQRMNEQLSCAARGSIHLLTSADLLIGVGASIAAPVVVEPAVAGVHLDRNQQINNSTNQQITGSAPLRAARPRLASERWSALTVGRFREGVLRWRRHCSRQGVGCPTRSPSCRADRRSSSSACTSSTRSTSPQAFQMLRELKLAGRSSRSHRRDGRPHHSRPHTRRDRSTTNRRRR
mgnify:CR=1 FL=1